MTKKILCFCGIVLSVCAATLSLRPQSVYAADCSPTFLGFRTWYDGLEMDSDCTIQSSNFKDDGSGTGIATTIWHIVLNVMNDLMIAVGLLAVGFLIYGGYLYILSQGDPGKVSKGKTTIRNAVIGLVIALAATAIINTIKVILTAS